MTNLIDTTSTEYTLGINTLDHDHLEFAHLLNQLKDAGTVEFIRLFSALYAQTEAHFSDEKSLMLDSKYPDINAHIQEHAHLLRDMKAMDLAVRRGAISDGRQFVCATLPEWFHHHVTHMDNTLAAHLRHTRPELEAS